MMKEYGERSADKVLAYRQDDFGDGEMADGAIAVVILLDRLQDGMRERVVRHADTVQWTDNILRRRPVMVVEGLGAGHAAEREQQHPCGYLSQKCAHCSGKGTFFTIQWVGINQNQPTDSAII